MNKKVFLIALPALMALSGCSNIKPIPVSYMTEDTLAHEEIFGDLDDASFSKKLEPNKALNEGELYTPLVSFQHKRNNDGTYSVRFIATIESKSMDVVWTRSVHDLNGSTTNGKTKATKQVETVYESLNDGGVRTWATEIAEKDDELGTKPFNYFAVYCLLNIPNSVSDYFIDAFVTVTLGNTSKNSYVGSTNVADKTKHMKYSLEGGSRYVAEVNGVLRESEAHEGNNLVLNSVELSTNDKLQAYYIDANALTYKRYDYSNMVRNNPDFKAGPSNEISLKHSGIYNVFLNTNNLFSFEKKIYFQGPSWWANNSAAPIIDLKHTSTGNGDSDQYKTFTMLYNNVSNQHYALVDISFYDSVQFFRRESGGDYNYTGFMLFPTNGDNMYTRAESGTAGAWSVFGGDPVVIDESGFNIVDLTEPVDIHTEEQAAFLAYTGDYSLIPDDMYPDGTIHKSDSKPVTIQWNYTVPNGRTLSKYSVVFGQKADLSDGYTVNGTASPTINLYNPYLGRNYYKVIANFSSGSPEESAIHHFDVDTTYPRNLTIEGMTNCRDMGGRVTEDGGYIKQGLVYRTSGKNQNGSLTSATTEEMVNHLKLKNEINLAGDSSSYNLNLSGTTLITSCRMDTSSTGGYHHLSRNTEAVKNFFEFLANENNYPLYYHCKIGTDRTGVCSVLLSGLLGVSLNEIYQDYLFSNFGKIGEKRGIGTGDSHDMLKYVNDILDMPGDTFKNKVYNILLGLGLSRETLDTVIDNLTEGNKPSGNNNGQVIAPAIELTGNGTNRINDTSDRNHPDYYYTLNSSNQSVSYSFNSDKTYNGLIVAYLGNNEASTTKKIGDAISLKLDDSNIPIQDITYYDARMGKCTVSGVSRMNYFPVKLSVANISQGSHTIKITGSSNTMNIAGIYIYRTDLIPDNSGSQGGGDDPIQPHTTHNYVAQSPVTNIAGKQITTYLCECGKKYTDIKFTDYSSMSGGGIDSDGKIGGDNKVSTTFKWDIPATAGNITLQFNIKMSSSSHSSHSFDADLYAIKINNVSQSLLLEDNKTYGQLGFSTSGQYFDIVNYNVPTDGNLNIEFIHNNSSYRLLFTEQVRIIYE